MFLASADQVLSAGGFPISVASRDQMISVLDQAMASVISRLETDFERHSYIDHFSFSPTCADYPSLRLSHRFLTEEIVTISSSSVPLLAEEGTVSDVSSYSVDRDKGIVQLLFFPATGYRTLSVSYEAGFEEDATTKVIKDAPKWISQVAIAVAVRILNSNPTNPANRKAQSVGLVAVLEKQAEILLRANFRERVFLTFPTASVISG